MKTKTLPKEAQRVMEQALAVSGHASFRELACHMLARSLERQGRVSAARALRAAMFRQEKPSTPFPGPVKPC